MESQLWPALRLWSGPTSRQTASGYSGVYSGQGQRHSVSTLRCFDAVLMNNEVGHCQGLLAPGAACQGLPGGQPPGAVNLLDTDSTSTELGTPGISRGSPGVPSSCRMPWSMPTRGSLLGAVRIGTLQHGVLQRTEQGLCYLRGQYSQQLGLAAQHLGRD